MKLIRQGDVLLKEVKEIKGQKQKQKDVVLAEGEVTGHKHTLMGQVLVSEFEGNKYVELTEDSVLTHQEHDTLEIPKGKYQIILQREVDLLGEIRQVMD